jgi:hypothetical protein
VTGIAIIIVRCKEAVARFELGIGAPEVAWVDKSNLKGAIGYIPTLRSQWAWKEMWDLNRMVLLLFGSKCPGQSGDAQEENAPEHRNSRREIVISDRRISFSFVDGSCERGEKSKKVLSALGEASRFY